VGYGRAIGAAAPPHAHEPVLHYHAPVTRGRERERDEREGGREREMRERERERERERQTDRQTDRKSMEANASKNTYNGTRARERQRERERERDREREREKGRERQREREREREKERERTHTRTHEQVRGRGAQTGCVNTEVILCFDHGLHQDNPVKPCALALAHIIELILVLLLCRDGLRGKKKKLQRLFPQHSAYSLSG
jgi:hypothetical protein